MFKISGAQNETRYPVKRTSSCRFIYFSHFSPTSLLLLNPLLVDKRTFSQTGFTITCHSDGNVNFCFSNFPLIVWQSTGTLLHIEMIRWISCRISWLYKVLMKSSYVLLTFESLLMIAKKTIPGSDKFPGFISTLSNHPQRTTKCRINWKVNWFLFLSKDPQICHSFVCDNVHERSLDGIQLWALSTVSPKRLCTQHIYCPNQWFRSFGCAFFRLCWLPQMRLCSYL